jgi:hypothetical protein
VRVTLEIQRHSGNETRSVTPGELFGTAEGLCPGCGSAPFRVSGTRIEDYGEHGCLAGAVSVCCQQNVGYLRAEPETLFGREEDEAVLLHGRARVYGGTVRK